MKLQINNRNRFVRLLIAFAGIWWLLVLVTGEYGSRFSEFHLALGQIIELIYPPVMFAILYWFATRKKSGVSKAGMILLLFWLGYRLAFAKIDHRPLLASNGAIWEILMFAPFPILLVLISWLYKNGESRDV